MDEAVIVLTNERDLAADDVVRRLTEQGVPVSRLNAEAMTHAPSWDTSEPAVEAVRAVWWRQFEIPRPEVLQLADADELLVIRAQWRAWLSVLADGTVPWVNDLWAARRAENKVEQLRAARRVGLVAPDTLITNSVDEASKFSESHPAVVKSLAAGYFELSGGEFVYASELEPALQNPQGWPAQPLVVQRRVSGRDVRIIVVDRQSFGASCLTASLDWRRDAGPVDWVALDIPADIHDKCLSYLNECGLRYAAFDFVQDNQDQFWFLEANQAGEFAFLDRILNLGVAQAVADLLAVPNL